MATLLPEVPIEEVMSWQTMQAPWKKDEMEEEDVVELNARLAAMSNRHFLCFYEIH